MKEPHNHRKVGYSMIVISVSLVVIGLIVWAIGDNYHYSSDLMAGQEIDSMTPKNGYNIVLFDDSQPVGAKLKLLDHAETNTAALALKEQYANSASTLMIFDSSTDDNTKLVADAKSTAAQIAQEKISAAEKANQETQSVSSTNHGNESATISPKLNNTNSTLSQTEQETLTEKINMTSMYMNQTAANGTSQSVNLTENINITSK